MMKGCVFCTGMSWYMLWAKDKIKKKFRFAMSYKPFIY